MPGVLQLGPVAALRMQGRLKVHLRPGRPGNESAQVCYAAESGNKSRVFVIIAGPTDLSIVIACDKREAFAQGSASDEAIHTSFVTLDCFARNDG